MDFEVFRPDLGKVLAYSDGSKGGRPPFDVVLMFKIQMIQALNSLSDEPDKRPALLHACVSLIWGCRTACLMPKRSDCFADA